ncbi:MAG: hypothetical protein ABJE81_05095 [Pseudophaeobacter sp.]
MKPGAEPGQNEGRWRLLEGSGGWWWALVVVVGAGGGGGAGSD